LRGLPVEQNLPGLRFHQTTNNPGQRRFASSMFADQSINFGRSRLRSTVRALVRSIIWVPAQALSVIGIIQEL
jgi:hypothetical protein